MGSYRLVIKKVLALAMIQALNITTLSQPKNPVANLVLLNGTIYTVNKKVDWDKQPQESIAINGTRIAYVGNNSGALDYVGPESRVIDLQGKMVLPGFIDSHMHPSIAGSLMSGVILVNAKTSDEYLNLVKTYVMEHPNARVIRGFGWAHGAFGPNGPTKELLDSIVPDKPVALFNMDAHSIWVNSKVLEVADITKDTPDPAGGIIERDSEGNPSGTLKEISAVNLESKLPPLSNEETMQGLAKVLDMASECGITTASDCFITTEELLKAYSDLDRQGKLNVRIRLEQFCDHKLDVKQILALVAKRSNYSSDLMCMKTAKLFIDGVNEAHTALLLEPYADRPGFKGTPIWNLKIFNETIAALDKAGFQIEVHAVGDGAVRMALNAYENAMKKNGKRDSRHKVAHMILLSAQDLPRFKAMGVIPVLSPNWFYCDSNYQTNTLPSLGLERAEHMYPMKSIVDSGATVSMGTDFPACGDYSTMNPLEGIRTGIVRLPITQNTNVTKPLWPEEKVDLKTLIECATINGAYTAFLENETGSLEVGKMADLIVLDKDLFKLPPEDINKARVLNTILEGREVYGSFDENDTTPVEGIYKNSSLQKQPS